MKNILRICIYEIKFNELNKATRNALNEVVHSCILIPRIILAT